MPYHIAVEALTPPYAAPAPRDERRLPAAMKTADTSHRPAVDHAQEVPPSRDADVRFDDEFVSDAEVAVSACAVTADAPAAAPSPTERADAITSRRPRPPMPQTQAVQQNR